MELPEAVRETEINSHMLERVSLVHFKAFTLAAVGAIGIIEMLDPSLKRKPDDME